MRVQNLTLFAEMHGIRKGTTEILHWPFSTTPYAIDI